MDKHFYSQTITTAAQLDAALAAQREQRIAKLRRLASGRFHWFLLVAIVGLAFNIGLYFADRQVSSLVNAGVMGALGFSCYSTVRERRSQARAELDALEAGVQVKK